MKFQEFALSGYDLLPVFERRILIDAVEAQIQEVADRIEAIGNFDGYDDDQFELINLWGVYNKLDPKAAMELYLTYHERGLMGEMYQDEETGEMAPDLSCADEIVTTQEHLARVFAAVQARP